MSSEDVGQVIYIEPGQAFATWPAWDEATTYAIQELLAERHVERGRD